MLLLSCRDDEADVGTATKWDEPATIKRLEKCLAWRRKEQIDDLHLIADKVEAEVRSFAPISLLSS